MRDFGSIMWLVFCIGIGYYAKSKGRSAIGWGLGAFFFSPILAGLILALSKDRSQQADIAKISMEQQQIKDRVAMNEIANNKRFQQIDNSIGVLNANYPPQGLPQQQQQYLNQGMQRCPNCGQYVRQDAVKCRYCGANLQPVAMQACPYCKETIPADAKQCPYCHSTLQAQRPLPAGTPMKQCPYCHETIPADATFCGFCGGKLQ